MSRFDFGPLDCEPSGLMRFYDLAVNAQEKENFVMYTVPEEVQTRAYAAEVLGWHNGPDLAAQRADLRLRREATFLEVQVPRRVYTTAAALTNLHIVGRDVLLEQLNNLQTAVEADVEAGPASALRVGIVPARYVRALSADVPPNMSFKTATDIGTITTPEGLFVAGGDWFEIDRQGTGGARGAEADRRLEVLEWWAGLAVSGAAAIEIIEQSRSEVSAA